MPVARAGGHKVRSFSANSRRNWFYPFVIARPAKWAVAIQMDCFVAPLLAMTVY